MTDNTEKTKAQLLAELEALRREHVALREKYSDLKQQLRQSQISNQGSLDTPRLDGNVETPAIEASAGEQSPIQTYKTEQLKILSQIAQQMKDAVILTDADEESRIRYVNDAFTDLYGYEKEEVLGKPSWVLFAGSIEDKQHLRQQRKNHISKEGEARMIYQDLRKDGTPFWVANTLSVVQVDDTYYDLGIVRDISARKQTEEALHHRTAELEALRQLGMELTAELELDTLLHTIVARAVDLIGGRAGLLGLYDPRCESLKWDTIIGDAVAPKTTKPYEGLAGQVWATREPLIVDNYDDWDKQIPGLEQRPITSVVGVPITWSDTILGVLEVEGREPGEYTEADAELLSLFAHQVAIALHNAQLFQAERKQREMSEALASAALAVSPALNLDQVLDRILEQVARVVKGEAFNIMFIESDNNLRVLRARGYEALGLQEYIEDFHISVEESVAFRGMMKSGEPVVFADITTVSDWEQLSEQHHLRSYVAAPIQVGEEIIGFLNVDSVRKHQFNEEDAQRLQAFANHVSVAIEHARLFQAECEQRKVAEALVEATFAVGSALDLERILDRILTQVARVVKGDAFNITFIEEGDTVRIVRSQGYETLGLKDYSASFKLTVEAAESYQKMMSTGNPIVIPDLPQVSNWAEVPVNQEWLQSYVAAPIQVNGETVGFLNVDGCHKGQFNEEDAQHLQAFANHVSVAIEHARLFQAEREQREMAEALAEATFAVSGTLDLEQVLDRILEKIAQVLDGSAFNIMLVEDGIARIARWRGYERFGTEDFVSSVEFPIEEVKNLKEMKTTGKPVVIRDTRDYEGWVAPSAQPWLRSYVAAPIQIEQETVGYLNIDSDQPNHFDGEDARYLQVFANYVATAIDNARLFKETQHRVAELEALQRVVLRLTSTLKLSDVLDAIVESVLSITQANDCHIFLYDEETATFTFGAALWTDGSKDPFTKQPRSNGLTARVVKEGAPLVINETHKHPLYTTKEASSWGLQSIAGFPLKWRDRVLGAMNVAFLESHTFTKAEIRVLGLLADHAAIAIENAQLHRQVVNYATDLEARVTERTQQLQTQYARVEAILNNTSDGLVVTNEAGDILHTNPVAHHLFNKALLPEEATRLHKIIQNLGKQATQHPEQVVEIKGLDLQLKAAPIFDAGADNAAVVNIHDITHLNAMHRMRAQFISNVSHELRTPATTIKLYADLLREAPPEKWDIYLDALVTEAQQQAKLVEDILHISRIDAGRLAISPAPTSLNEVTEKIVTRYRVLAQQDHLTLTYSPSPDDPIVFVDSDNFGLVINNLLRNAIQYTPEGGRVTVTIDEVEHGERTWATLTVADTGIGIPKEELPYVFDRFFRGALPQDLQISGTGLGLAIVKQIVELHGGLVTAESEVNEGTTFTVWVPLAEVKE